MLQNVWKIKSSRPDKSKKDWLTHVLAKNRQLDTPAKLNEFLSPSFDQITSTPVSDITKGLTRVIKAIENKEKSVVYSDYDADGICATAIMWETLYDLGANIMPYVPHRIKEGYGLSKDAITTLAGDGVKLIITVDHGVTAVDQVEHAKKLGVDVVITDHHVLPKITPKSIALVHSTQFCGAGVSWRFCWELIQKVKKSYENKLLDKLELAALATIADLVPLVGGSRSIVKIGLEKLTKTNRPGIKALMRSANLNGSIGTPRINAMGRIEHGLDSLRLLCARNQHQADELAKLLSKTNSKRQDLTTSAIATARDLVLKEHVVGVIAHESWHEGVIGLVASRMVEYHNKPMIVIARGPEKSKGSARSIPGFNIVEAIRAQSEFLVDAGGHPMAAGFTIETKHIESFTAAINKHSQALITEELLVPVINIECPLEVSDVNKETFSQISKFEPYGIANPEPIFVTKRMIVEDLRTVGPQNNHLKLQVNGLSAIAFNKGELKTQLRPGYVVDLVYTINEDRYSGGLQLKVKDLQIVQP
ncbi:single-stranded-DNA-specific exonuclease RecJ [Candidatus Curtissbacteria bacterium]|nr:single-stranded-DNA-specific exonuclease RecJ [Candidatus Curtissbacteria bacterium]